MKKKALELEIESLKRRNKKLKQRLAKHVKPVKNVGSSGSSEGQRLANEGSQRAYDKAPQWWKDAAEEVILEACQTNMHFSSDEIWWGLDDRGIAPPHVLGFDARAYSGSIGRARANGWCEPNGEFIKSQRPEQHASDIRQYQSLIWEGPRGKET